MVFSQMPKRFYWTNESVSILKHSTVNMFISLSLVITTSTDMIVLCLQITKGNVHSFPTYYDNRDRLYTKQGFYVAESI